MIPCTEMNVLLYFKQILHTIICKRNITTCKLKIGDGARIKSVQFKFMRSVLTEEGRLDNKN